MACLDMYSSSSSSSSNNQNSDHKSLSCSSPRISFSNDFAESNHHHHQQIFKPRSETPLPPPPPSDFEFSAVSNHSMMSADELFSKGRLLPFKNQFQQKPTTLREELLMGDDEDDDDDNDGGFSLRPPKGSGSTRWKEIFGLRKTHIGSRKTGDADGCVERRPASGRDLEAPVSKTSQELLNDGRSSSRDVEFGM